LLSLIPEAAKSKIAATLCAALDMLTGKGIGECRDRHTADDSIPFLQKRDTGGEQGNVVPSIADTYSTHKTSAVKEYLKSAVGRFEPHCILTHSLWLNMIERWFAEITNKRIRRESGESVIFPQKTKLSC
jgi:hypothetical protein